MNTTDKEQRKAALLIYRGYGCSTECWLSKNPTTIFSLLHFLSLHILEALQHFTCWEASSYLFLNQQTQGKRNRLLRQTTRLIPLSSALPAVASWHGLSCVRTPKDILLTGPPTRTAASAPPRCSAPLGSHSRSPRVVEEEERGILVES